MGFYMKYPLAFWEKELGIPTWYWKQDLPPDNWTEGGPVPLWSKQREIIEALVKYKKVAVKSGHGIGKTFLAAGISLYLAYIWKCIGLTTAPTFRQVRRVLWSEIHHLYNTAPRPLGGKLNQVSLDLGDRWFVEGFATDKPISNITGIHEENVFVIIDEAGGVAQQTLDALEGILTSANTFVLMIGNPIVANGPFWEAFQPNSGYHQITVSCYDCPNVRHNRTIYSKLTSPQWVLEKERKWGYDSSLFRSRVLGEFPNESKDVLIPLQYIQAALDKDLPEDEISSFGLDIARQGLDRTVYGMRWKSGKYRIVETETKRKVPEIAGKMKNIYDERVPKEEETLSRLQEEARRQGMDEKMIAKINVLLPVINVDDTGVGGGVTDILVEDNYPTNPVISGESPDEFDPEAVITTKGKDATRILFLNKRSQYYWNLKKYFEEGKIDIDDEELAFELSKLRVVYLRSGKIKIIDKEELKKEIGRSPDLADACMLTFALDGQESGGPSIRWI